MRSQLLKTTILAAVAGAMSTQMPQVSLRLRRLSLKCWFMGHDDWIRRTPDRLYLECLECGRETHRERRIALICEHRCAPKGAAGSVQAVILD